MFGLKELVMRTLTKIDTLIEYVLQVKDAQTETRGQVSSMETWVELLADTKADAVAEEFERLLKEHHSSGQKTTNTVLKELVHQAVLNSK